MRRAGLTLLIVALAAVGCESGPEPAPEPVALGWRSVAVPVPPGGPGEVMLRDAVACPGVWFAVGAVRDSAGGTRPAAWTSPDGTAWSSLTVAPDSYYGKQNVLSSVACKDGRLAALGAKAGGAHAYPRTSSWYQDAAGVVREAKAPFILFGGSTALNVARMDAGPAGFLISGNRMSGAAVWKSPDAVKFTILEAAPVLKSDAEGETWAFDSVGTADGWLLVGGLLKPGRTDRDPLGWRSADGSVWQRVPAAGATDGYEEFQRVVLRDAVPVAVGLRGPSFGAWRLESGQWQPAGSFGSLGTSGLSGIRALSVSGGRLFCVTTDGSAHALWISDDAGTSWRTAGLPVAAPVAGESALAVAGGAGRAVLVWDDGKDGRIYVSETGT